MAPSNQSQSPELIKTSCKYGIVLAAVLSGGLGWCMTALVLNGTVEDFRLLDSMTPTAESAFDKVFVIVLVAGLAMFATSLLGCIGVLRGHKGLVFAFSIASLVMAVSFTMAAVSSSMILTGSVPPIIMQTNRICRNQEQISQELGCGYRRLGGAAAPPAVEWSYAKQALAAHAVLTFKEDRRLEAGTTELQLVERIAANQNEDKCALLVDICKLPEGVTDMNTACTCNGLGVFDMERNSQADMDWACPQRIATEHAPPECGSFCADWDGSGDLDRSWCFVNRRSECNTHITNLNTTFGDMEPSTEACQALTLLKYPWSGIVARGIFVAKVGMGSTACMAALMYFSTLSAWFIIWCTPGNKYWFSEAMALQPLGPGEDASDTESRATTSRRSAVTSERSDDGDRRDRDWGTASVASGGSGGRRSPRRMVSSGNSGTYQRE